MFYIHITGLTKSFSGAFAKLRMKTVSFVMCVRPSVLMEQLDSHLRDFREI